MKILHIINALDTGGAQRLIAETIPLLKPFVQKIDVLLLKGGDYYFKKVLEDQGITIFTINNVSLYSPCLIFKIKPYLKSYDLIHVHLFPAQYWVAIAHCLSRKKPVLVTTEHNTTNKRRNIKLLKPIEKLIYRHYKRIIGISSAATHNMLEYIGYHEKCLTIENGVRIDRFHSTSSVDRSNLGLTSDDFVLVMVAAFRKQKDQDTLISCLKYLPEQVKVVLVGDGERKLTCEELASRYELDKRVLFLGVRNDIPEILQMADVAVVSSHWEGFGLVAVEGMAAHKPLIASDVPGVADIVSGYGLLFKTGDATELACLVKDLMSSQAYYNKIADKCYQRAQHYDIQKMITKTIELYSELLAKN